MLSDSLEPVILRERRATEACPEPSRRESVSQPRSRFFAIAQNDSIFILWVQAQARMRYLVI